MRRTPIKRTNTGLVSTVPMRRSPMRRTSRLGATGRPLATANRKRGPKPPDPLTPAIRAAVAARSGGRCEAGVVRNCRGVAEHVHHRKLRRFGDHTLPNLLHMCNLCHSAVHLEPALSYATGFLVRGHESPARTPLDRDGWYVVG